MKTFRRAMSMFTLTINIALHMGLHVNCSHLRIVMLTRLQVKVQEVLFLPIKMLAQSNVFYVLLLGYWDHRPNHTWCMHVCICCS
jgi:hypothetical protein